MTSHSRAENFAISRRLSAASGTISSERPSGSGVNDERSGPEQREGRKDEDGDGVERGREAPEPDQGGEPKRRRAIEGTDMAVDEIEVGPGSNNDKLRYTKTKCTHLLAYIDSCYPDPEIHQGEPDVESANEGYV